MGWGGGGFLITEHQRKTLFSSTLITSHFNTWEGGREGESRYGEKKNENFGGRRKKMMMSSFFYAASFDSEEEEEEG